MKTKRIEAQFGDLVAYGKTKTEAKNTVMEMAERACKGSYEPIVKRMGEYLYIVWRDLESWLYQVIDLREPVVKFHGYASMASKEEALRSVQYHVGCLLRDDGEAMEVILPWIDGLVHKREFLYYWAWQECMKLADPALSEMERRAWADANRREYFEANYRCLVE